MTHYTTTTSKHIPNSASANGWSRLAGVSFAELLSFLWARKLLMLLVFVLVFGAAMAGVMTLKKTYTAKGRVLVQFGEEYIYNPIIGTAGQGTAYSADQMIQAEVGFITAAELKERVLNKIGLRRLYPKLALDFETEPGKRDEIRGLALENMDKALGAFTAPNQPMVTITFRHTDPQTAQIALSAFIEEYQAYRREILLDDSEGGFEAERKSSEKALREVNTKMERFLTRNGIGDFVAERISLGASIATLREQLLVAEARRQEISGSLSVVNVKIQQTPQTIEQFTDDASSGQLANLKLEREQLLARYKPQSSPVQEINARITRLERYLQGGASRSTGTKRTGINTVYQSLQTNKMTLETEQRSNAARIVVLSAQIAKINARQQRFQKLFPEYQRLSSQALIMESNYVQFATREQENKTLRNLAALQSDNIRIIERPVVPVQGKSLKKPAAVLAVLFAGFTALSVGLFSSLIALMRMPARAIPVRVDAGDRFDPARPVAPGVNPYATPPPAQHMAPSYPYIQTQDPRVAGTHDQDLPVLGNIANRA